MSNGVITANFHKFRGFYRLNATRCPDPTRNDLIFVGISITPTMSEEGNSVTADIVLYMTLEEMKVLASDLATAIKRLDKVQHRDYGDEKPDPIEEASIEHILSGKSKGLDY